MLYKRGSRRQGHACLETTTKLLTCWFVISGFLVDRLEQYVEHNWSHIPGDLRPCSGQNLYANWLESREEANTKLPKMFWEAKYTWQQRVGCIKSCATASYRSPAPVLTSPWPNLTPEISKKTPKRKRKQLPKRYVLVSINPFKGVTPYSTNSLFSELFRKFSGVVL